MPRTATPDPTRLRYGLLGPLAAWWDGKDLDLGTPQQRTLLALLLLRRNEPLSADYLIDALWGEDVPANALATVHTYVSRLRQVLVGGAEGPLVTGAGGYRLVVAVDQLDVDRFDALAAASRTAIDHGKYDEAQRQLGEALALVRGAPLAGLDEPNVLRYEAERLAELVILAHEDLVDVCLAQGRHREVIPELRRLVGSHPFHERFWAQLMLALYRSGRQADALHTYREARGELLEELGLEPNRELRALERSILVHDRAIDHQVVGRLHGVPRHTTSFVGRRETARLLAGLVRRERLVTLVGPAGVGKTRLAAELVPSLAKAFPDGVWWVDMATAEPTDVGQSLARGLGIRPTPSGADAADIISRLRASHALLVLDDCEHVTEVLGTLLGRIVTDTTDAHLLVTSREPLRLPGEHVFQLEPLSTPPDATAGPEEVMEYEAARLLAARALAAGARVQLDDRSASLLAEISGHLDGLPLAIELAAVRLRSMSMAELARALDAGLAILAEPGQTAPARQRTLEAAILWSYRLLTAQEQSLLRRLAAFAGSFDAQAARAVAAAGQVGSSNVLPLLLALVEKSLVVAEVDETSRYHLLQTVRSFAEQEARRHRDLQGARQRHRRHYIEVAEEVAQHMLGPDLAKWLPLARLEHDNLLGALRSALADGEGDASLQIASALAYYWYRIGYLANGRLLLRQALELAPPQSPWRPRGLVALAWLSLASESADAVELAEQASVACEGADPALSALALLALGSALTKAGRPGLALDPIRRARAIYLGLDHAEGLATADQLTGAAHFALGDHGAARAYLIRARDAFRSFRGSLDAGWTLVDLADVALKGGEAELARSSADDAIVDFRSRGDQRGLASAIARLGQAYLALGDRERGDRLLVEAAELADRLGYGPVADDARAARTAPFAAAETT